MPRTERPAEVTYKGETHIVRGAMLQAGQKAPDLPSLLMI